MDTYPQEWQYDHLSSTAQMGAFPKISEAGFTAGIIVTWAIAIGIAAYRTWFRVRYFKKLYLDDYILFYSV